MSSSDEELYTTHRRDSEVSIILQRANYWTRENEKIANRIRRQTYGLALMYEWMGSSSKHWDDVFTFIVGVCGLILGTTGIVSVYDDSSTPRWIGILDVSLGFLVGIITILSSIWQLGEMRLQCARAHADYSSLNRDVAFQISQPKFQRQEAGEYLKRKTADLDKLSITSPSIPLHIQNYYRIKFVNSSLFDDEPVSMGQILDTNMRTNTNRHANRRCYPHQIRRTSGVPTQIRRIRQSEIQETVIAPTADFNVELDLVIHSTV